MYYPPQLLSTGQGLLLRHAGAGEVWSRPCLLQQGRQAVRGLFLHQWASDHKMIHVVRLTKSPARRIKNNNKRILKNFNEEGFKVDVNNISW